MKIVDRKTFLSMPSGTVYSFYKPCLIYGLQIKYDTINNMDFAHISLIDCVDADNGEEYHDILLDAEKNGTEFKFDYEFIGREGMFDEEQKFVAYSKDDVQRLINTLKETI